MDYENLIEQYRQAADKWEKRHPVTDTFDLRVQDALREAAGALSTLQAESEERQKQLNEFSEFLCHITGNLLRKTNYTAQAMISAAEDYQQNVCGKCDLRDENEMLRAELERVTRERDALTEDFVDYVTGGVPNPSIFCKNRCNKCVDMRGWCTGKNCKGFYPSGASGQKED